jgi:DNA-binding transcriptional LysR family regulator
MNLRQLRYFMAIADQGSFTRAAEQLLVAQPSLSQQIKSLEQDIGGPLLERLPTGVRLTAAGKALLPEARAAVAHAECAWLEWSPLAAAFLQVLREQQWHRRPRSATVVG